MITKSGRDLTGALIDTKTSEKYPNQTASQIAETLAGKYGLTPVVTSTSTKTGLCYEIDHVRTQDERTEWDVLTWLAREERFNCYVQGKELHLGAVASTGKPDVLTYSPPGPDGAASANATKITTSHSLTLAKDIAVTVQSWNAKNKKAFTRKAHSSRTKNAVTAGTGKSSTPTQEYSYAIPCLQPDEAQNRANQILAELSKQRVQAVVFRERSRRVRHGPAKWDRHGLLPRLDRADGEQGRGLALDRLGAEPQPRKRA